VAVIAGVVPMGVMHNMRMTAVVVALMHYASFGVVRGTSFRIHAASAFLFGVLTTCKVPADLPVCECVTHPLSAGMRMTHARCATATKVISRRMMTADEATLHHALFSQTASTQSAAQVKRSTCMRLATRLQCASACTLRQIEKNHRLDVRH